MLDLVQSLARRGASIWARPRTLFACRAASVLSTVRHTDTLAHSVLNDPNHHDRYWCDSGTGCRRPLACFRCKRSTNRSVEDRTTGCARVRCTDRNNRNIEPAVVDAVRPFRSRPAVFG
jgi:hypothetical protein